MALYGPDILFLVLDRLELVKLLLLRPEINDSVFGPVAGIFLNVELLGSLGLPVPDDCGHADASDLEAGDEARLDSRLGGRQEVVTFLGLVLFLDREHDLVRGLRRLLEVALCTWGQ